MKNKQRYSIIILSLFIMLSCSIRLLGLFLPKFENYDERNSYFSYKKIAQNEIHEEVHSIVIIPQKRIKIIKIFKKPLGITTNDEIIGYDGNLFKTNNESLKKNLIKVDGDHTLWKEYYKKLKKHNLLKDIYHAKIYHYRIDLWVEPGVLVQLEKNIHNLYAFKKTYPRFFKKGTIIDLRDTKRVGISKMRLK